MNTKNHSTDQDALEREWQAQEQALEQERLATDSRGAHASELRYRLLARALRQPLDVALPSGFAREVARKAGLRRAAGRADFRFELAMTIALISIFGIAAAGVARVYGIDRLLPDDDVLRHLANALSRPWLLMFVACLGVSRLWGWHRRTEP